MRYLAFICVASFMTITALNAVEQQKPQCQCKNCECSVKSHCGCFAKKGCPCGNGQNCPHRASVIDDDSTDENLLALNRSAP